jgi:transposase-like protein/IS1 family transposase
MECPVCEVEGLRYGKNRNGTQRFVCRACKLTFSEPREQAPHIFADQQLTLEKATAAVRLLMEGASVRSTCRIVQLGQHTLLSLLLRVGMGCERLMHELIVAVPCYSVQCDELWSFVFCKQKTKDRRGYHADELGDCYTWTGLEPRSKLLLAYAVGKRDNLTGLEFVRRLRRATAGDFQINTDGLGVYQSTIPLAFGYNQDHARVIKIYAAPPEGEARYSPPQIVQMHVEVGGGKPNLAAACTSHVERSNLTIRMMLRRFTRLTNAHSKSWDHHEAALGLLFAVYNFVRPHATLTAARDGRKCTPAMAAGLATSPWSIKELIGRAVPNSLAAEAS